MRKVSFRSLKIPSILMVWHKVSHYNDRWCFI